MFYVFRETNKISTLILAEPEKLGTINDVIRFFRDTRGVSYIWWCRGGEQTDKYNLGMDTLLLGVISASLNDKCCCNI